MHNTLYPTSPDDPSSMFPGWAVKVSQMLFPLPPSLAPPSTFHLFLVKVELKVEFLLVGGESMGDTFSFPSCWFLPELSI